MSGVIWFRRSLYVLKSVKLKIMVSYMKSASHADAIPVGRIMLRCPNGSSHSCLRMALESPNQPMKDLTDDETYVSRSKPMWQPDTGVKSTCF